MNATKLLAKYEMLAEAAHKTGAYACARKWSIKAEKLEAVISALETVEEPKQMTVWEQIKQDFEEIIKDQITLMRSQGKITRKDFDEQKCVDVNWKEMTKYQASPDLKAMIISKNIGGKFSELESLAKRIEAYNKKSGFGQGSKEKEWCFGAVDEESF